VVIAFVIHSGTPSKKATSLIPFFKDRTPTLEHVRTPTALISNRRRLHRRKVTDPEDDQWSEQGQETQYRKDDLKNKWSSERHSLASNHSEQTSDTATAINPVVDTFPNISPVPNGRVATRHKL
jgi:hypothetical protein